MSNRRRQHDDERHHAITVAVVLMLAVWCVVLVFVWLVRTSVQL